MVLASNVCLLVEGKGEGYVLMLRESLREIVRGKGN